MPRSFVRSIAGRLAFVLVTTGFSAYAQQPTSAGVARSTSPHTALVNQYCLGCHNSKLKVGGWRSMGSARKV